MAIKLKWVNPNAAATVVEIYRGDAPLDRAALTGIQVTLSAGETSWIDATAVYDRVYYYVFVTKRGVDRVVGPNIKVEATERRGAGPNTLKYGNDVLGYYGKLLNSEFFSQSHILAAAKNLTNLPNTGLTPNWHKFSRNGKTLYVPEVGFGAATWNDLYNAGLVYGVDGPGPQRGALAAVNQKTVLSLNGDEYMIRLPLGYSNSPGDVVDLSALPSVVSDTTFVDMDLPPYNANRNEFNDIIYPMMCPTPIGQRLPNVHQADPYGDFYVPISNGWRSYGIVCQERQATDFCVMRGNYVYNSIATPRPRIWLTGAKLTGTASASLSAWHRTMWIPVLELVTTINV